MLLVDTSTDADLEDVLARTTGPARDQSFTSELMERGDTYSRVFGQRSRFEYFCTLHPDMVGWVIVEDGGGAGSGDEAAAAPVAAAAADSDQAAVSARSADEKSGLGWIAVGVASALVFGGGAVIFEMLRRELVQY